MASTELVTVGDKSDYLALRIPQDEVVSLIQENLGGDGLSPTDLDRVKVPAGGGTTWEVPTVNGEEAMKVIEGVIVERATRRAYWPDAYSGQSEPPMCFSEDGMTGHGSPGGPCGDCAYNQFGSGDNGVGKACKEVRQLFVLTPDSLIPLVVNVPPASLSNVKSYFLRLLRGQMSPLDVTTKISLKKAKSKTGIDYSQVELSAGTRLDPEAKARMREYATLLKPAFEAAAKIDADEI